MIYDRKADDGARRSYADWLGVSALKAPHPGKDV